MSQELLLNLKGEVQAKNRQKGVIAPSDPTALDKNPFWQRVWL